MHVADLSKGILGANGIVGGGFAIATGAALSAKLSGNGRVAVTFFGDGAANQGVFMECLNVSTLWQLPLVFVCEYNHFCEFTPTVTVTAGEIADRARAFKIPCEVVDGNDVIAVRSAAAKAIEWARSGKGPAFIEAQTYRIQGHLESEDLFLAGGKYREKQEIDEWRKLDPISRFGQFLVSKGVCTTSQLDSISTKIAGVVEEAVRFAEASELADPELTFDVMFAGQKP